MSGNAAYTALAKKFADSLSAVEDSLYQTRNQSGEDPLNFPIRLNDQMSGLMGFVASGERRPPKQAYDVYTVLGAKLTAQSARLDRIIAADLPKLNAMLKANGQPEIVKSKVEPPLPPKTPSRSVGRFRSSRDGITAALHTVFNRDTHKHEGTI